MWILCDLAVWCWVKTIKNALKTIIFGKNPNLHFFFKLQTDSKYDQTSYFIMGVANSNLLVTLAEEQHEQKAIELIDNAYLIDPDYCDVT